MSENDKDALPYSIGVHVAHCCGKHGCKYGDADCPVEVGQHKQSHPCERCPDPSVIARLMPPGEVLREQIGPLRHTLGHCRCGKALRAEPNSDPRHMEGHPRACDLDELALVEAGELSLSEIETAEWDPDERRTEIRGAGAVTSHVEIWEPRTPRTETAAREIAQLGLEADLSEVWLSIAEAIEAYDAGARNTVGTYSDARISAILARLVAQDHLNTRSNAEQS